jgi:phosphinothricin acetyltransferase
LENCAKGNGFHKLVLFTFASNDAAHALYRACGFNKVGVFRNQGIVDGKYIDIVAMEKVFE